MKIMHNGAEVGLLKNGLPNIPVGSVGSTVAGAGQMKTIRVNTSLSLKIFIARYIGVNLHMCLYRKVQL